MKEITRKSHRRSHIILDQWERAKSMAPCSVKFEGSSSRACYVICTIRESQRTSDLIKYTRVWLNLWLRDHWGKSFIENSYCWAHSTCCYSGRNVYTVFNWLNSLLVTYLPFCLALIQFYTSLLCLHFPLPLAYAITCTENIQLIWVIP